MKTDTQSCPLTSYAYSSRSTPELMGRNTESYVNTDSHTHRHTYTTHTHIQHTHTCTFLIKKRNAIDIYAGFEF